MSGEETAALQLALAAENAADYGYGAAGAQLAGQALTAARTDVDDHRAARDLLADALRGRGVQPDAAAPAYSVPALRSDRDAMALLARLDDATAAAYAGLLAVTDDVALRRLAATALEQAAVRAARWRRRRTPGAPAGDAFPGLTG